MQHNFVLKILIPGIIVVLSIACFRDNNYTPKPRAYPRVEFPEKKYRDFNEDYCPFTFEYPVYGEVQQETRFLNEAPLHPCWFDIWFSKFNARMHFSYYQINDTTRVEKLINDAFTIANKINQRSNYMDEVKVANQYQVGGLILEFTGPAASPMHFFLTDTTQHFLKGALYFNTQIKPDSLAPISNFIKEDIAQMINTFQWK
jgi:gliding motility-associated lipoprotein GldD